MQKHRVSDLHPDLVIDRQSAIDRMGLTASESVSKNKANYDKQILLVRRIAKEMCSGYRNCRIEDWCWHCNSGQTGPLFRGVVCFDCKLLTADAILAHKPKLVQINLVNPIDLTDQS
jgi:hypothetical protein